MMDIQKYINSGVLELYVFGNLSDTKSREVSALVAEHPELLEEVERIEKAMFVLSQAAAPKSPQSFDHMFRSMDGDKEVILLSRKEEIGISRKRNNLITYLQVAAGVLMIGTIGYQIGRTHKLENKLVDIQEKQILLEDETRLAEEGLAEVSTILTLIRDRNIIKVPLAAQAVDPEAYASVFWNNTNDKAYVDVRGLPQPPLGKVYQVWSLTLKPLTPTSIGILDGYDSKGIQIFELNNPNASQAFGITLEPEGGSKTPTMDQLYTLGVVTP